MSDTGEQETKTIGIYSSRDMAEQAIKRIITRPGFRDFPEYFKIDEYIVVDRTGPVAEHSPAVGQHLRQALLFQ
jgi:hypothetical protein